ncbi:hypothetical protein FB45DRAFT_904804 [Roridomyces roridus]|uniref:Pentatricopeptide repeat-containing protein n=1 Tax=Roridomyces roridus TaxID=1738132 RepID=A0AAD7C505_9AGAR|nr:hypothetical protein FB45DRAFT_904804 [Roridomyces roridus]
MVEPAASVIFNTLLQSRSTLGQSGTVYSVSRVMSRPSRLPLTPGFFNPQPRRVKGKERMTDPSCADILSFHSARSQEWSCRMRVSVGCSSAVENSDEEAARRWFLRRPRKPAYTVPRHFPSDPALPPAVLRRGQTRYASNFSDRPFSESDPPSSNEDPPRIEPLPEASAALDANTVPSNEEDAVPADSDSSPEFADVPLVDAASVPSEDPDPPPLLDDISETDSPPQRDYSADIRYFRALLAEESFQPEKAWHAYEVIRTHDLHANLTSKELVMLAKRVVQSADSRTHLDDLEESHQWGRRVRELLAAVPARGIRPDDLRNLTARALALEGDLQTALDMIHAEKPLYEDYGPFLRVYESILVSTWLHHDRVRAVEFLILEWKILGSYLMTENSRTHSHIRPIAAAAASLRKTAFAIVTGISLPSFVLADKQSEWKEEDRKYLGEFLIEAFFRSDAPSQSLQVFKEMQRQNLKPLQTLPLQLARVLARDNLHQDAHALFASLEQTRMSYDYLFTGLYLYSNEGRLPETYQWFDRITARGWQNPKVVLQLMYAYAVQGQTEKTLEIFEEYFPEDQDGVPTNLPVLEHFAVGVFAHAQRGDFDGMAPWLQKMRMLGLQPDVYIYTTILKSFAMRGDVAAIASILDEMRAAGHPPNIVTYTTVMTLLANRRDPASTEAIYARAVKDGIVPDSLMISVLMNAHVEAGSWKGVIRAFDFIRTTVGVRLDIGIFNILLKAYIQIGAPFRVVSRVFNMLERHLIRPDSFTFTMLIQSACDARQMNTAVEIFTQMENLQEQSGSSYLITTWTMTAIMAGFVRVGQRERAMAVYEDMVQRGLKPSASTYNVIVAAYGTAGTEESFQLAEQFIQELADLPPNERPWDVPRFGRISSRDLVYMPLMRTYASRRRPQEVERLFQTLLQDGGEPTLTNLGVLLDAYVRVGDIDSARQLWPQIFELGVKYSSVALFDKDSDEQRLATMHAFVLCIPLSWYLDGLSRAGLHDEIASVWKTFQDRGFAFSADNWNQLAIALLRAREFERCFEVLERVIVPNRRRSNLLRQEREFSPASPLSLVDTPAEARTPMEKSLVGKARSEATKWGRFHRRVGEEWDDPVYAEDLAHHLHILHRISPFWNTWHPNHTLLRGLFEVLLRLRAGYPADATSADDALSTSSDVVAERTSAAYARLKDIYSLYPDAVVLVEKFERKERERLGRWFTRVYRWAAVR